MFVGANFRTIDQNIGSFKLRMIYCTRVRSMTQIRTRPFANIGQVLCFPCVNRGNLPLDLQLLREVPNSHIVAV